LTLTIAVSLTITTTVLPNASTGIAYSATVVEAGGTATVHLVGDIWRTPCRPESQYNYGTDYRYTDSSGECDTIHRTGTRQLPGLRYRKLSRSMSPHR
jgi:hypothetical protein